MRHIMDQTCVQFTPRRSERDYLHIYQGPKYVPNLYYKSIALWPNLLHPVVAVTHESAKVAVVKRCPWATGAYTTA